MDKWQHETIRLNNTNTCKSHILLYLLIKLAHPILFAARPKKKKYAHHLPSEAAKYRNLNGPSNALASATKHICYSIAGAKTIFQTLIPTIIRAQTHVHRSTGTLITLTNPSIPFRQSSPDVQRSSSVTFWAQAPARNYKQNWHSDHTHGKAHINFLTHYLA